MALSALLIEVSLCIPVVMTSLFHNLPPAAVRSGLLLPALFGTLPTVLYIALPMAVGLAIALEFARMASEGMVAVLYSLRLSVWSICAPAALVATAAVGLGYWLSCEIAPAYIGQLHDVIYIVRNSLNHRMLEPAQFYTFDNGKRTLYFERWVSPDVVAGMFIHQFSADDKDEEIITARQTQFQRTATGVVMIMSHGSIQTRPTDGSSMRTANFDQYVMPIDMQGSGGLPKRNWRGVFELPLGEFLQERAADSQDPWRAAEWMSEATKRFGIPILALAHAFLGIGLILNVSNATGRSSAATLLTVLAIPVAHIAILIGAETLVLKNPHLVIVVALAIAAEFAAGIALLSAQNANFALARRTNAAVLRRRPA
jgi:lipopolysaccharide export system permease protein